MYGHDVTVFDARQKAGGLNEFGIAAYKSTNDFAAEEVFWLLKIGGIKIELGKALGRDLSLEDMTRDYDAVFLGFGLAGTNALGVEGEQKQNVEDAVSFIVDLRQASDLSQIAVGRHVAVIGGGMTAVDAAVQAKLLGAEQVHLVYRRGRENMNASKFEQDLAASHGVHIIANAQPVEVIGNGAVQEVEFAYTHQKGGKLEQTGETFRLKADQVSKTIGQTLDTYPNGLELERRKIAVTGAGRTSVKGIWAGGDCTSEGDDLTVTAVAQGRDAAEDIHKSLLA